MAERPTALRLGILVFDGVMMSSIAAPSDALRVADKLDPENASIPKNQSG